MSELARLRSKKREYTYKLQDVAGDILGSQYRVSSCMKVPRSVGGVEIKHDPSRPEGQKARYNVCACGSMLCPVCAPRVHAKDRENIEAVTLAKVKQGLSPLFLTVTIQHDPSSDLGELYSALLEAWRSIFSGDHTGERKVLASVKDQIKTPEIRYGLAGWHPHLHILLYVDENGLSEEEKGPFEDRLSEVIFSRYERKVSKLGHKAVREAFHWRPVSSASAAAQYVTKLESSLSAELSEGESKESRSEARSYSYTQLLALYERGERKLYGRDLASLVRIYAESTRGRRHISYSRGCKAIIKDQEETPEDQVSPEDPGQEVTLYLVPVETWREVISQHKRAELLEVAEDGDSLKVAEFLALIILRSLRRSNQDPGEGPVPYWD